MDNMQQMEDGFGEATMAELSELRKALEIGYTQPVTGTGFDALRVESLEQTLKLLTYSAVHARLWNNIPKQDAFSTVEEYNRLVAYGSDGGGFVPSGVLPEEEDTTYERADQKVKYIGTTRSVHHPATLVRTVPPDLIAQETQNGTLWMIGKANRALYYGDSNVIPLEWNGLTNQIIDGGGNVMDLRGSPLARANLEDAAQLITDNYGIPGQFYSGTKVFSDFDKVEHDRARWSSPNPTMGVGGTPLTGWKSIAGQIDFQPDTFVKRGGPPPTAATSAKAPSAPTVAVGAAATNAASKFVTADAGNYKWQFTAVNNYGESLPTAATAATAIAAGQGVPLTITDGGGTYAATGYKVYRTSKDGTTILWTNLAIPRAKTGGVYQATTTFTDVNEWLPGTFIGLILDVSAQSLSFKQLSPLLKMNLAVISPAIRWMQLLYGTPIVYAPKKNIVVKNIGLAT